MSNILERKFTEEEISNIMYEGGVYKDYETEELLYETVSEKQIDFDQEKSSVTIKYVIKDIETGKCYSAELGKSPWYGQNEHNTKQTWTEVKPKKREVIDYE